MRDDASAGRDPGTQGLTGAWSRGGRYRIEGCVARGGMGVIYAVEDRELQRRIAMKVIGTGNGFQEPVPLDELPPSWVDRFMGEARITAQLDHPGVVPVHEAGLDPQGRLYFTMKLVRGRRLGKIFRLAREEREGWTLNRAVDALLRASLAVTHAHEQGIVHRDLKPDNIMVGRLGEVFVMDWGVARRLGRGDLHELRPAEPLSSRVRPGGAGPTTHQGEPATADSPVVTLDGTVIGTPAYMSPEHAAGRVEDIGKASDVYSLGAILYELLAGHPPYASAGRRCSGMTVLQAIRHGPPDPIGPIARDKPAELAAICAKATARSARDRYADAGEFAADLQAWVEGRVVSAHRTGALAELKAWILRNRLAAFSQAVAVSLLVLGLLLVISLQNRSARRISEAGARLGERNRELGDALYAGHVLNAAAAIRQRDYDTAGDFLSACEPRHRNWEWRHLECTMPSMPLVIESGRAGGARAVLSHDAGWVTFIQPAGWLGFLDVRTGGERRKPIPVPDAPYSLALSPGEGTVAVGCTNGMVCLVEVSSGRTRWRERKHEGRVAWVDFSPDGSAVLSCGADGCVRLVDAGTGNDLVAVRRLAAPLVSARFAPDSLKVVVTSAEGPASVLSGTTLQDLTSPDAIGERHLCAAFSPEGGRLLTGGADGRVRVWDATTGKWMQDLLDVPEKQMVNSVAWSADGRWIAWTVFGEGIRIAEADSGRLCESLPGHVPGWIPMLQWGPNAHWLLASGGSSTNATRLWRLPMGGEVTGMTQRTNRVWAATFTADSQGVISAAFDGVVRLSDAADGRTLRTFSGHDNAVIWSLAIAPGGREFVSAGQDCTLRIWDVASGALLRTITAQTHPGQDDNVTLEVAVSPDGRRMASAGFNGNVQVWDYAGGDRLWWDNLHRARLWSVSWSPDGSLLAAGGDGGWLAVWDARHSRQVWEAQVPPDAIGAVAFHPDGSRLLTAHWSGDLRLWETQTGRLLRVLPAHRGLVRDAAFSPDGSRIASVGADQILRLWDGGLVRSILTLPEDGGTINTVAFSPDGRRLLTGGDDGAVRVWQTELPEDNAVMNP